MTEPLFPYEIFAPPPIEQKLQLQGSSFYEVPPKNTYDSNAAQHSYEDKPSSADSTRWNWYKHGQRHRDNGQPAVLYKSYPHFFSFFKHDQLHRLDNLPAQNMGSYAKWYVRGSLHRTDGPCSLAFDPALAEEVIEKFALYGLDISKSELLEVNAVVEKLSCPTWVATLHVLEALTVNDMNSIIELNKNGLPFKWLAKAFNLENQINRLHKQRPTTEYKFIQFDKLLGFTNFQMVVDTEEHKTPELV